MTHIHKSKRAARRERSVSLFLYRAGRFLCALTGYHSGREAYSDAEQAGAFFGGDEFEIDDSRKPANQGTLSPTGTLRE